MDEIRQSLVEMREHSREAIEKLQAEQDRIARVMEQLVARLSPSSSTTTIAVKREQDGDGYAPESPEANAAGRQCWSQGQAQRVERQCSDERLSAEQGRTFPKLATCAGDPWKSSETDGVVMWLNMAISSVRRMETMERIGIELWLQARISNKALAEIISSAERMLPTSPYEDFMIYARDRITGALEQEDRSRWMEATLAVHQRTDEPLTGFLTRLETALNELTANQPEEASSELLYFIYRGSLSQRTRDVLEKTHLYSNRARDLTVERRLRFLHSCLYQERLQEQLGDKKPPRTVGATTIPLADATAKQADFRCRTCETNAHSFRDCARVKERQRCFSCGANGHMRAACPHKAKEDAPSQASA